MNRMENNQARNPAGNYQRGYNRLRVLRSIQQRRIQLFRESRAAVSAMSP